MNNKLPEKIYTIEEFKNLFKEFGIEEDNVRFYLGKYYLAPKAYGIYQIGDEFIVYKVKDDGQTSIRYQGPSEEKACDELYKKFLQEVSKRQNLSKKYNPYHDDNYAPANDAFYVNQEKSKKQSRNIFIFVLVAFLLIDGGYLIYRKNNPKSPKAEYYRDNDNYYKKYNDDWYYWDDSLNDWYIFYPPYDEYYYYDEYDYYDEYEYDNDYDYDYDYSDSYDYDDYDSFDFDFNDGFTDWDSDW